MRRLFQKYVVAVAVAAAVAPTSTQAQVIDLLGDKDCFGLGGSCPDGTRWQDDLGGVFFTSNQGPGDPAFTDTWTSTSPMSWTHTYALPATVTSASLLFRTAGIADFDRGPLDVFFGANLVGTIPDNSTPDAGQAVATWTFAVNPAWLTGADVVSFTPKFGDGYSIDYSELTINVSAVPEPATVLLVGGGLLGLGAVARRRRA